MKEIKIFLLIILGLVYSSGIAYASCQIQYDAEADRVLHLGGNILRGNFATKEQCLDFWKSRPAFEQNHSKCVGCDGQHYSQPPQRPRVIIGGPANRTPEEEEMVQRARRTKNPRAALKTMKKEWQQKQINEQKEQQSRAVFEQDKKKCFCNLKVGVAEGISVLRGVEGNWR